MGLLEDLDKFARDVGDGISNVGNDAQAALDRATRNTAALAGSGVNRNGKVTGPLADMFGEDPHAFITNVAAKMRSRARELCVRVASRTGKVNYDFSTLQGKRRVTARPTTKASVNQIALTLALCALDSPATMQEEAGRMASGLPVKPRGLTGFSVFPMTLPQEGAQERGLVLEGATAATILAIVVPIIAAIAAAVLPGLISAAGAVLTSVTGGGGNTPEKERQQQEAAKKAEEEGMMMTVVGIGLALLLGGGLIYALTRKRKAAA